MCLIKSKSKKKTRENITEINIVRASDITCKIIKSLSLLFYDQFILSRSAIQIAKMDLSKSNDGVSASVSSTGSASADAGIGSSPKPVLLFSVDNILSGSTGGLTRKRSSQSTCENSKSKRILVQDEGRTILFIFQQKYSGTSMAL